MKNTLFIILTMLFIAGQSSSAINFYPEQRAAAYIKKTLKVKEIKDVKEVEVQNELRNENEIVIYSFKSSGTEKISYAIFTEAPGRHEKFDYLIITNSNKEIEKVKVLKYRSEHGSEIASKKWLKQFEHYSGGALKYGKDISAISGATISAKSITSDIPRALSILKQSMD